MNIIKWLLAANQTLINADVITARLDCLILLEDVTGKDRGWLLAHPEFDLSQEQISKLNLAITRRVQHEPLAYIRGKSEFYGREFIVNENTLEPRPETESMIELVKSLVKTRENITVGDIGTGSGCIAVSVKLELPHADVVATDIDVKSLKIARENSEIHDADITFHHGNLLEPLTHMPDILLCNLPYVPDTYELNTAATFEPKRAIFGGEDGLDIFRQLFGQIQERDTNPFYVLTESLPFQHADLTKIAKDVGFKLLKTDDFIQIFTFEAQLPT